jgi:DnaK suppressor protein
MDESTARELLRAERAEVATLVRDTEEATKVGEQTPDSPSDYGDAGKALTEEANDEAVADQLRGRLDAIDRALARLEAGTYGRSVLSGKPIPDQRLEADPAAELTVEEARAARLPALVLAVGRSSRPPPRPARSPPAPAVPAAHGVPHDRLAPRIERNQQKLWHTATDSSHDGRGVEWRSPPPTRASAPRQVT